jgi:hypothetical protein
MRKAQKSSRSGPAAAIRPGWSEINRNYRKSTLHKRENMLYNGIQQRSLAAPSKPGVIPGRGRAMDAAVIRQGPPTPQCGGPLFLDGHLCETGRLYEASQWGVREEGDDSRK